LICDPRVDPSSRDNFAMRLANENNHIEVFKVLINDSRCSPQINDNAIIQVLNLWIYEILIDQFISYLLFVFLSSRELLIKIIILLFFLFLFLFLKFV
jgi:hypothetical protein